jgi:DNA-binding MarR family transcriptional regulator
VLREVMRLYIIEQRRILADDGMPGQGRLLSLLLRRGSMTQAEFGRLLGFEKSWVSRSVDKLVEHGWVVRSVLPSDRRNIQLELTPAGTLAARAVDERLNAHAEAVLGRLPAAIRTPVVAALRQLRDALLDAPGPLGA